MRRQDKKIAMKKANMLFEERCNENRFNWNGKYANEDELEEGIFLGDDNENLDGEEITSKAIEDEIAETVTNITTDINDTTKWFSDEEGEIVTDKEFNN
jgi:hypothetical protein